MNKLLKSGAFVCAMVSMGCSVYHPEAVSIEQGVNSQNRVKVATTDNLFLELKELTREQGQLYGITGRHSDTAKLMFGRPQFRDGNNVKIALRDEEITSVHLKNRSMSNIVNIGVPLVGAAGLLGLSNPDFRPDVGN